MPEQKTVVCSTVGYVATDGTTYNTLAALLAAGKTCFPGYESSGLYPRSVVLTSLATGDNAAGSKFEFAINAQTAPTKGTVVQGSGQQFVEPGLDSERSPQLIQSIYLLNKAAANDDIFITATF